MIPIERRQAILKSLQQEGIARINTLAEILNVSHMTVRRDLQKLEEEGLVVQVSGGVQATKRLHIEPSHQVKESLMSEEKKRIGKKFLYR